ncbi:response regulator [Simiduia sp. 21SJ11W-1]|uniref:response regulator n=1 Tax=Simiduia sp. 21SJ11W-1 TaxID=2909669 RepID=UPI0020A1258E|nr:response regulator [Simiduia sp. 21SJ11W-1]UTA48800.1 response regulator [Simiduia sp. 21SJ11W-1]
MKRILVVEDSQLVTKIVKHVVKQQGDIEAVFATNFAEAKAVLANEQDTLFAALTDLNLPDAPDGEVVDLVLDAGVPVIVLTGSYDDERRDKILSKGIVDYVVKEGRYSYEYAVGMVQRLERNQSLAVLVVDDSATSRRYISELLVRQGFKVYTAANGKEAIKVILAHEDVSLVITDYHMPEMDGVELVKNLRHKYGKSDLVIIGLSGQSDKALSAKFIKNGANDFLIKPFNYEEFNCRVRHNVESLELIRQIRDATFKDYLTGIWSRRYFYERGELLYSDAVTAGKPIAAAIIDLDHFRRLNDQYGHEVGDCLLVQVAELLQQALKRFLVARAGGEEFFALLPGLDNDQAQSLISQVRQIVSARPLVLDDGTELYCTFSAGVTNLVGNSLDDQIAKADEYLIRAKEAGRDLVVGDDDDF